MNKELLYPIKYAVSFSFLDSDWKEKLNRFEKEKEKQKLLCDLYEKIV